MNNKEIIKDLSEEIVKRLEEEYGFSNIKKDIEEFLEQALDEDKKLQVLKILYEFTLYKNGYIAADPRIVEKHIYIIKQSLKILNENDFELKIKQATDSLKKFEDAERNPIATMRRKIEDKNKYNGCIF